MRLRSQVYYDPKECTYEDLLKTFFEKVDPTTLNRQGNDAGTQYRSGIYYHNEEQRALAEKVRNQRNRMFKPRQRCPRSTCK